MALEPRDYSIHLLGLGGAGCNIIEAFLKSKEFTNYIKRSGVKVSCLAIDVADHDIYSLQKSYDKLKEAWKAQGIPPDRVFLIARSVKFPTPEAMFEFIEKYPEFLEREEIKPRDYRPWLSSSMEIPPLSGGVGRRRALSKAIYGLNYYYLRLIDGYMELFKEQVSSSTIQPIIFVIFGIGGGSGSGMMVDLLRHLRAKLGSGFPIIALCILPCAGDDPPAKGVSAYATLTEFEYFLNRRKNQLIKKAFGRSYENPLTACLMMPLGPAFSRTGSMIDAKKFIDDAIADILTNCIRFDLSDLLNNIGATLDLGDRWIHTITTLRISYPINEHIELIKMKLEQLDKLREVLKDKLEVFVGDKTSGLGGLKRVLQLVHEELREIFRAWMIEKGTYQEEEFEDAVRDFIYQDKMLELNYNMQVKGAEEAIRALLEEFSYPLLAIGLDVAEGTVEARIRGLIRQAVQETREISRTFPGYHDFATAMLEDLEASMAGTRKLTLKHKLLLGDLMAIVKLVDGYLEVLKLYMEAKTLADRLGKEMAKGEKGEAKQAMLTQLQQIQNPELVVTFSLLSALLQPPTMELKSVDSHLSNTRIMRRYLNEQLERLRMRREALEMQLRRIEGERKSLEEERSSIKLGLFSMGKKRYLSEKLEELDREALSVKAQLEELEVAMRRIQEKVEEYGNLERKFDVNSDYRKYLSEFLVLHNSYLDRMAEISKDKGYYDRVADVTEQERLKIMQKILNEEEESLTRENILNEIIDKEHLKEYLVGTLRILRLPSSLGLNQEFRTDYMWVTVSSPRGVWNAEMASELKATLSGYISGDASRSITIREIDSSDPWTIRFLVIAAKARVEDLETYPEMKSLYEQAMKSDRLLAHSLLLEQGIVVERDLDRTLLASKEAETATEEL